MKDVNLTVRQAKNQDQKAFNDLFNFHWDYLYKHLLKKTGNSQMAEEISIITFARAFDRISTFDEAFEFKTWLLTISKNIHLDQLRRDRKKVSIKTMSNTTDLQNLTTENHPSPEDILITYENLESLKNHIKSLSDDYQKVISYRFFMGLSYNEICNKMNQPINTVKVKIMRAKQLLNKKINDGA
jgi:RNA polymerase sigma-70 factor (ECF subfamily)